MARASTTTPATSRRNTSSYLSVTPADVKRVANKYLTPGRVILSIVPMGKIDQASKPDREQEGWRWTVTRFVRSSAHPRHRAGARRPPRRARSRRWIARRRPPAAPPPVLHVPGWTKATLANGAELIVAEKHDLPLVSFTITFLGGANQFEPAGRQGLAGLTASMMSEGTRTRDGEALSNALQLLGTNVSVSIGSESGSIGFLSTTTKFAPTLDVLADMLLNSTFPADALERLRGQRLVALTQAKSQPGAIANRVFPRLLYGSAHPYGLFTTEESYKAITRDDIVAFQKSYFEPGRALVTVVGDVNAAAVQATIDKALAGWARSGQKPTFTYPAVPAPKTTTIYPGRQAGRGAVDVRHRQPRPAAIDAGLLRAAA